MVENAKITYRKFGDYMIPNLTLPLEETNIKLGEWGTLHKNYLLKHKNATFTILLSNGELWQHLSGIDTQAEEMYNTLVEQMKQNENITEQLKAENQMEWVQKMNNIQNRAREIVYEELIYR